MWVIQFYHVFYHVFHHGFSHVFTHGFTVKNYSVLAAMVASSPIRILVIHSFTVNK